MNIQKFKECLELFDSYQQQQLTEIIKSYTNIIILGNGGSNAISSHMAQDYTKMLGKRAIAFGDSPQLSCYANDYGYENAYQKFLEHYLLPNTLVILISSSGKSQNILNAAEYCVNKAEMITMSGFDATNSLRKNYSDKSLMHFYVPSYDYGIVEIMHNLILHSVL
jgi:D-sedoheptulose 7-phosphate isomerase